jgi:hypothetical protein
MSSLRKSTRVAFLLLPSNGCGSRRSLPALPPLFDLARPKRGDIQGIGGPICLPSRALCPKGTSWSPRGVLKAAIRAANRDPCVRDTLELFSVGVDAGGEIAVRHWASKHWLTQVRLLSRRPPIAAALQRAHEQSDSRTLVPPFQVAKRRIERHAGAAIRSTPDTSARRAPRVRPFLTGASGSSLPFGELYPLGGIAGAVVVPPFRACALISRYVDNRRNRIADRGVQFGLSPFAGNTGIQLVQQVNETLWWRLREIIPVP